jgi:hypothetical protein
MESLTSQTQHAATESSARTGLPVIVLLKRGEPGTLPPDTEDVSAGVYLSSGRPSVPTPLCPAVLRGTLPGLSGVSSTSLGAQRKRCCARREGAKLCVAIGNTALLCKLTQALFTTSGRVLHSHTASEIQEL